MRECGIHKLVADVALLSEGQVLLVRYKDTSKYDGQKGWFLPDNFLNHLEHPDDAAKRILREQAGIEMPEASLSFIESFGNGWWHLVFHYLAELRQAPNLNAGDNIAAMDWFPLDRLPDPKEMAHHGWGRDVLNQMLKLD
ncbi:MAG: NUDIX domain-containing protein [Chloroflexi bacterium]|nr:NUDIX domain-containing protein [Chloroflexota bacterium]